jgi:hypothetical protein
MSIETQVNKSIYSKKEQNSIDDLQDQFDSKYKQILLLDNTKTAQYHQLYDELQNLIKQIKYLIKV